MPIWNLLNTSINVNTKGIVTGSTGNTYAYTSLATNVPANVQPINDSLRLFADGRKVAVDYKVWVAQPLAVNPADQVVWNGTVLKVNYMRNLDVRGEVYEIHCTEFRDNA